MILNKLALAFVIASAAALDAMNNGIGGIGGIGGVGGVGPASPGGVGKVNGPLDREIGPDKQQLMDKQLLNLNTAINLFMEWKSRNTDLSPNNPDLQKIYRMFSPVLMAADRANNEGNGPAGMGGVGRKGSRDPMMRATMASDALSSLAASNPTAASSLSSMMAEKKASMSSAAPSISSSLSALAASKSAELASAKSSLSSANGSSSTSGSSSTTPSASSSSSSTSSAVSSTSTSSA